MRLFKRIICDGLFAKSPPQAEQWGCWFYRRRIIVGSTEIAANSRVLSVVQIEDQRVREDAGGMLALGPSCVCPRRRSSDANSLSGQRRAGRFQCRLSEELQSRQHLLTGAVSAARPKSRITLQL